MIIWGNTKTKELLLLFQFAQGCIKAKEIDLSAEIIMESI